MKPGKIIVAGLVVTIFDAIVGMVSCGGVFNWVYKLEPTSVWRPMEGPPGALFFVGALALNIILAAVYGLLKGGIPGKSKLLKGLIFGLCVWAVGTLPGMFASHSFTVIATTVIVYWTLLDLIQSPLKGMIIAAIYGE